jgi:hypothetical protein
MADYRPSNWAAPYYRNKDPIERCRCTSRNYRPYSRYSPYVDPNFRKPCYHYKDMPHMHDPRYTKHGAQFPPATNGYIGFKVPMCSYYKWEN